MTDRTWRRLLSLDDGGRANVDNEIRAHLEMRAADLVARGLSPDESRREAARRFGDVARVAAEMRALGRDTARRAVRRRMFSDNPHSDSTRPRSSRRYSAG